MIKYVASDLDGTLLPGNAQTLDPEIFDLILRLKEKGIHFIAASGRQYYNLYNLFGPVQNDISYIAENGSLCIHQGKVISRGIIGRELGLRIIDASRTLPSCGCMLSCESRIYTESSDPKFLHYLNDILQYDLKKVSDLHDINEPFLKLAMCDFSGTAQIEPYFKEHFSSEISVVTSGNIWVDFIAPGAHKGSGLANITKHLGLSPEDGIAFGDQYNDIEMLETAGTSYAMKTCAPGVEMHADFQTDSVPKILQELLEKYEVFQKTKANKSRQK